MQMPNRPTQTDVNTMDAYGYPDKSGQFIIRIYMDNKLSV